MGAVAMAQREGNDADEVRPPAGRRPAGRYPPWRTGEDAAGWASLDWPDLSPDFPSPETLTPPPPRPDAPADVGERVRRAEATRGIVVPLCALAGALLVCAGAVLAARLTSPQPGHPPALALLLIFGGLVVAFPVPALVTLLVIGPTWRQRQQHYALLRWRAERTAWRDRERSRYLATLAPADRERFLRRLTTAGVPSLMDGDSSPTA